MSTIIDKVIAIISFLIPATILLIIFPPIGDGCFASMWFSLYNNTLIKIYKMYTITFQVPWGNATMYILFPIDKIPYNTVIKLSLLIIICGLVAYGWRAYRTERRLSKVILTLILIASFILTYKGVYEEVGFNPVKDVLDIVKVIDDVVFKSIKSQAMTLFEKILMVSGPIFIIGVIKKAILPVVSFILMTILFVTINSAIVIANGLFSRFSRHILNVIDLIPSKIVSTLIQTIYTMFVSYVYTMFIVTSLIVTAIYLLVLIATGYIQKIAPILLFIAILSTLGGLTAIIGVLITLYQHVTHMRPILRDASPSVIIFTTIGILMMFTIGIPQLFSEIAQYIFIPIVLGPPIVYVLKINGRIDTKTFYETMLLFFITLAFPKIIREIFFDILKSIFMKFKYLVDILLFKLSIPVEFWVCTTPIILFAIYMLKRTLR